MTKQLTDSEHQAFTQARLEYENDTLFSKPNTRAGFSAGFVAGLSHNQAKLDKLISFIKGEVTRGEIEEILNA